MFRYLEKYVGTYRVLSELDSSTSDFPRNELGDVDESYDELYIPCKRGIIKHTYRPYYLAWYSDKLGTGRSVRRELDEKKIPYVDYDETDSEVLLLFEEVNLKKIASVVKPLTKGKSIPPLSSKNLKVKYTIPDNDLNEYKKLTKGLSVGERLKFGKEIIKGFDLVIAKSKGKRYNVDKEKELSGLPYKEYVHSIGLWKEFIKFIKEYKNGKKL